MKSAIVSSKWLSDNFDNPDLVVLDASQSNDKSKSNRVQIIGARPFDIKDALVISQVPFQILFPRKNNSKKAVKN